MSENNRNNNQKKKKNHLQATTSNKAWTIMSKRPHSTPVIFRKGPYIISLCKFVFAQNKNCWNARLHGEVTTSAQNLYLKHKWEKYHRFSSEKVTYVPIITNIIKSLSQSCFRNSGTEECTKSTCRGMSKILPRRGIQFTKLERH